jgi:hypothetical protein
METEQRTVAIEKERDVKMVDAAFPAKEIIVREDGMHESTLTSVDAPAVLGVTWSLMKQFHPYAIPSWHSFSHDRIRENIQQNIFDLILQRRPNPSDEWLENLQDVSRKLEQRLYFAASNLAEYGDPHTLVER